ncbi:MAG: discoidin domain-containing protein, partial [Candidatus Paceibacterota bacterium]
MNNSKNNKMKKFIFVFALLVFSFPIASFAQAAATSSPPVNTFGNIVTIATVNVQDIRLVSQNGNAFVIAFGLSNRVGIQPKVIYAVDLLQKQPDGTLSLADRKIYVDDVLSLGENDFLKKEITYVAPVYLKGSFIIRVEARNSDALNFGSVDIKTPVTLNGTGEYIAIDSSKCFLSVEGEASSKKYTLIQGVDISDTETLVAHCPIKNTFKTEQTIIPVFRTYHRSSFGKSVGMEKQAPLTLNSGEKADFSVNIPKAPEPQAYDAVLTFVNEKGATLSGPVAFHYVIRGQSATIQNLTLDKDYYVAGDSAKITFFWSGSADGFAGSRGRNISDEEGLSAIFLLSDGEARPCTRSLTEVIGGDKGNLRTFNLRVDRRCVNPIITAKIVDKYGKPLAENTYKVETKSKQPSMKIPKVSDLNGISSIGKIIIWIVFVFLVLVALRIFWLKKNNRTGKALMIGLMVGLGVFAGAGDAKADTYVVGFYHNNFVPTHYSQVLTLNIDKSIYAPGETVVASGENIATLCANGYDLVGDTTVTINASVNGATKDVLNQSNTFVAQNTPGLYNAVFFSTVFYADTWAGGDNASYGEFTFNFPYTVSNPPSVTLSANPATVPAGWNTSLTWSSNDVLRTAAGYKIFRDGVQVGTSRGTTYSDQDLHYDVPHTYTIAAYDTGGNTSAETGSVSAMTDFDASNLVLIRDATVSSIQAPKYISAFAVDGDPTTRWASVSDSDPQWISIDLGSTKQIGRVVLKWESAYARGYSIQVSDDNTNWTTIYTTTTGNGNEDDLTGLFGSGRYIRMYGTTRATTYGYSLYEMEVYASSITNIAPSGTAYRWASNATALLNTNKYAAPALNDGNTTVDINLFDGTTPSIDGVDEPSIAYEAGGLIWPSTQEISSVNFIQGTYTANSNGAFDANLSLQFTADGTTWTNSGWTVSPAYPYFSSVTGMVFTFSGPAAIVKGVRVSGQVHTDTTHSWFENLREIRAFGTAYVDTQAPAIPSGLARTVVSTSQVNLSWTASTDNVGVTGYKVYRNGAQVGTVTSGTSYSDTGLSAGTTYSYTVSAYDAAGNASAQSASVSATTLTANIALSRPVSVSSTQTTYSASFAVDGNTATRWSSIAAVDPQWISVDLGGLKQISRVVLNWEAAYATAYTIQVSND